MSYVRKSIRGVLASLLGVAVLVAIAVWQFYIFANFTGANGSLDAQGGRAHLLIAISAAVLACLASFFVFSVFLRYDRDDEIHITAPPPRSNAVRNSEK